MTIQVGGKRYRYVGLRRVRMARRPDNVIATKSVCPACGADTMHVQIRGDAVFLPRAMRAPVHCLRCGMRFWVGWRPRIDRDAYYARRAGVDRETFRRWRDRALAMYRGEDGPRGA